MSEQYIWGHPGVAPPIKNPGEVVGRFAGWVKTMKTDAKGNITLELGVHKTDKYKALPLTDYTGIEMNFEVRIPELASEDEILEALLRLQADEGIEFDG